MSQFKLMAFKFEKNEDSLRGIKTLFNSKSDMVSSLTYSISTPNFINKSNRVGNWHTLTWQSQWAEFSYGFGKFKRQENNVIKDTVNVNDYGFSIYLPLRKLMIGRRLFDINGALIVPAISTGIVLRKSGEYSSYSFKFAPCASLQLPFMGIDFRLNTLYHMSNNSNGFNKLSFTPEIGFKLDGLWNLLDPEKVFVGHASYTIKQTSTSYSSTTTTLTGRLDTKADDVYITTVTKSTSTTDVHYSFDRYANTMDPMFALGIHYTYKNAPYAGQTKLFGLGYHVRSGPLASDIIFDMGKQGFASSALVPHTIQKPNPRGNNKVNKDDYSNTGHYLIKRVYGRLGIDLYETYIAALDADAAVQDYEEVKFTRFIGGIGYGYSLFSKPYYDRNNGLEIANQNFENNLELLPTSRNHAKFAKNTDFLSFYISIEAGALSFTIERQRYRFANLANVNTLSVTYLLPVSKIIKKRLAIKSYKQALKNEK